jgi:hypothetical protein
MSAMSPVESSGREAKSARIPPLVCVAVPSVDGARRAAPPGRNATLAERTFRGRTFVG